MSRDTFPCAIFDLDGTLLDTREDIAASVNAARVRSGLAELSLDTVVSYVGNGAKILIERAFRDSPGADLDAALKFMTDFYAEHHSGRAKMYPGVREGLSRLKDEGWKTALLTNKPFVVAERIMKHFELADLFDVMLGGGSGFPLKPAPDAVRYILETLHADPRRSWCIGDNWTDLECAGNAGLHKAFVTWGYGTQKDTGPDLTADSFSDLVERLCSPK